MLVSGVLTTSVFGGRGRPIRGPVTSCCIKFPPSLFSSLPCRSLFCSSLAFRTSNSLSWQLPCSWDIGKTLKSFWIKHGFSSP